MATTSTRSKMVLAYRSSFFYRFDSVGDHRDFRGRGDLFCVTRMNAFPNLSSEKECGDGECRLLPRNSKQLDDGDPEGVLVPGTPSFQQKQVGQPSPFAIKSVRPHVVVELLEWSYFISGMLRKMGRDFGGGEGPCKGDKVEDEPVEAAGASSAHHDGGKGSENSGGGGRGGGAAEASGGRRKIVGSDGGGGGGKRPPRHSRGKKEHGSVDLSTTETEDDLDMAEPSSSVFLPEKRDKWWLHKREFEFHHQGTKKTISRKKYRKKRTKMKSETSEDSPHRKERVRKRWLVIVAKVTAASRLSSIPARKRRPTPPPENAEKVKEHWEFSDSEISSDEEKDNLSATDDLEGQLDSEWLLRFEEIQSRRSKIKRKLNESSEGKKLPSEPDFLSVMLPLYRVMTLCGCFPFKILRSSDESPLQFQFVRKSKECAACVVSFFIFGLSSVFMTRNLISIYLEPPPYTIYDQVLAIEFDKFWSDAVILLLWFYFLAISNAALLIRGNNVAEFLNRWLEALTLIRYNATRGLRRFLVIILIILLIVVAYDVGDFFVEWGHIRASRGFIGLLIIDRFHNRVRLSLWPYRVAEYLGLFFHLYYSFCLISILALISAHAWAIENAARRFNLRLGLSLGILKPDDVIFELRKIVRWKNLFAEYLVVASFPKMLGKTFLVTLNALFAFLICLMVMSLYGLFSTILLTTPVAETDTEYFNVSSIANLRQGDFVPVKNRLSPIVAFSKEIYSVAIIWTVAFFFLELLNRPGSTIMNGSRFVFRKGFVHCRSLVERRFVASMMFSYATRSRSHVRPGFPIDRNFMSKFLTFAFGAFVTFIQFSPQQLQRDTMLICDVFGGCQRITISRVAHNMPDYKWNLQPIGFRARVSTTPPQLMPIGNIPEVLFTPPCNSGGSRPKEWPEFATKIQCDGSKASLVYQLGLFQLKDGRYARIPFDCEERSVSPSAGEFLNCFGEIVDLSESDECGNYFIPTPDLSGDPQNPEMQVSVLEVEGSEGERVFCCFVYEQLESQAEVCNLPEKSRGRCKKSQTGMEEMEASFLELWRSSGGGVDLSVRKRWASCLCQGIAGVAVSEDACKDVDKPRIPVTTVTTTTTKTTTTAAPALCDPYVFRKKMCDCGNADNNAIFLASELRSACPETFKATQRHLRLGFVKIINEKAEGVVYAGGGDLSQTCDDSWAPYPRYPPSDSGVTLYDCFGNLVSPVSFKDDCGNPKISFPNSEGAETEPKIGYRLFGTSEDETGIEWSSFLCCWDYNSLYKEEKMQSDICGTVDNFMDNVCAFRKLRENAGDGEFKAECGKMFQTVGEDENVNFMFHSKCEVNAPNPCQNN